MSKNTTATYKLDAAIRDALVLGLEHDAQAENILDIARPFLERAFEDCGRTFLERAFVDHAGDRNIQVLFPGEPLAEPEPYPPVACPATMSHVPVDKIRLSHRGGKHISLDEITRRIQWRLRISDPSQSLPALPGYWEGTRFVLTHGHADYIACLMLGLQSVLAVWPQPKT